MMTKIGRFVNKPMSRFDWLLGIGGFTLVLAKWPAIDQWIMDVRRWIRRHVRRQ